MADIGEQIGTAAKAGNGCGGGEANDAGASNGNHYGIQSGGQSGGIDGCLPGGLGGSALARNPEMRARLARTIEGEIIPRLRLAHTFGAEGHVRAPGAGGRVTPDDVVAFAKLTMANEVGVALAHLEVMRAQGVSLDTVFLDLLAPAARLMGDLWLADECSFIDVTIGLARLQQVVRELSPSFEPELAEARPTRRALLLTAPGEQHTLGVSMVEQFFRRAGWEVAAPPKGEASAVNLVRKEWFTMVGFSVSCVELLDGLQSTIRSLRHTSRNPDLIVMVGGNAFIDQPDLVSRVGADAMAADGRQAVLGLNGLLSSARAPAQPTRAKANWKRNGASGLTRYGSPV